MFQVDHTEELEELCQSAKQLHGNSYDADSSSDDEVWLYGENHKNPNETGTTGNGVSGNGNTGVGFRKKSSTKQNEDSSVTVRADINENISNREEISEDSDIFLDFGDLQSSTAEQQQRQQQLKDKAAADLLL